MSRLVARPVYSRVCETDRSAYLKYLDSLDKYNGAVFEFDSGFGGNFDAGENRGGGCNTGYGAAGVHRLQLLAGGSVSEGVFPVGGVVDCGDFAGGGVDAAGQSTAGSVVGVPCAVAGVGVSGVACASVGDVGGRGTPDLLTSEVVKEVPLGPRGGLSVGRGPNYERNRAAREKKRARRGAVQDDIPEWRRGAGGSPGQRPVPGGLRGESRGFFSQCDEAVRAELRNSRAARLVAENKLAAAKAEAEVSAMSGVVALVNQLNAVVRTAAQLEKNTTDQRVKSWAKTVVDSALTELSDKAPSSVPSLKSVGASSSASQGKKASSRATTVDESFEEKTARSDEMFFSKLTLTGLDLDRREGQRELNRRLAARQAADRVLRAWED